MADVTVNIRGDASQLRNELNNINPSNTTISPSSDGRSSVSSNDRMVEDIRREMQQRGVLLVPGSSSMTQIINQYGQAQRGSVINRIEEKYNERREDMRNRMSSDYDVIDSDIERRKQEGLKKLGPNANDPFYINILNQQLENEREKQYRMVGSKYDIEEEDINKQENDEKNQAQSELTQAIKELTDYFNRQSTTSPESFVGKLRQKQQALIRERDSAETEEEAESVSKRLSSVNEQLKRTLGEGVQKQGMGLKGLQMGTGAIGTMNSLQNGDLGGALVGSAMMSGNPYVIAAALIAAAMGKMATNTSDTSESLTGLAAFRSTTNGYSGKEGRRYLGYTLPNLGSEEYSYTKFGLSIEDFAEQARKRISGRGMSKDWYNESIRQIGLERSLALSEGSLSRGGQYDRYGQNVTDAVSKMVTILSQIKDSGVNLNDFTRVQEKYDIQQGVMASYMNRTDRPDYNIANNILAAFSATKGITQDSRMGGDIEQFQGMIQNPINERMKVLVYSTIADLFPETGGRMDLIDRALKNPENEGKIMEAVVKRITSQFGGTDTQMGYFAFKALLPNISPDRRDAYLEAISSGDTGKLLQQGGYSNQAEIDATGIKNRDTWTLQASGYFTDWTKFLRDIADNTKKMAGETLGTRVLPKINVPKTGGNK